MRDRGRSFATVARTLGYRRSSEAHAAFVRALDRQEPDERARLLQRELVRLDELEVRVRERDVDEPEKRDRRLAAVEQLRRSVSPNR
ncbi:MAG: hypothetical protein J2O39_08815 [Acidimicrobiales bacterium]|nr:hypothetical protein [Acidimicrobiales bacterium]